MSIYNSTNTTPSVVAFNSKNRVSGNASNFVSEPVDLNLNSYDSVVLLAASIPKSWYNVPSNYNTFTLTEKGFSTTITINVGSYNKINFASKLSSLLTAGSVTLGNNWTYVVSYPAPTEPDDFKYTFTVSGNAGFQPSFTFSTVSPERQMGFEQNTTYTFVANTLQSVNAINLAYVLRIFLKSNICDTATDGILAEFQNIGSYPSQSIVYYQETEIDVNTKVFNKGNTNSWNFSIVDSFDRIVDLNGIPFSFTLCFFQRSDTHEIHRSELMIQNEQRIFQIEQQQKKIAENVKKTTKETQETDVESKQDTSALGEKKEGSLEPIYPVQANYVDPDLIEPIDYIKILNLEGNVETKEEEKDNVETKEEEKDNVETKEKKNNLHNLLKKKLIFL